MIFINVVQIYLVTMSSNTNTVGEITIPETQVIGPDARGNKTVISYKINDKNELVKVTQKIKETVQVVKIPKKIIERKNQWALFGTPLERGNDGVITTSIEEVYLESAAQRDNKKSATEQVVDKFASKGISSAMKCRTCGGAHFTKDCPQKNLPFTPSEEGGRAGAGDAPKPGIWVPSSIRNRMKQNNDDEEEEEEDPTICITNLSSEATDDDLKFLCSTYGGVRRANVLKDPNTHQSRGKGFVTFYNMEDAQVAAKELNNNAFLHMIITVTLSTGRRRKNPNTNNSMRYLSGYGKALPQTISGKKSQKELPEALKIKKCVKKSRKASPFHLLCNKNNVQKTITVFCRKSLNNYLRSETVKTVKQAKDDLKAKSRSERRTLTSILAEDANYENDIALMILRVEEENQKVKKETSVKADNYSDKSTTSKNSEN
ncbi:hypothetical protein WA158_001690 [Blastocystis sp. Blastoise]